MWLNQLKIAIVEKNTDKINELMESLPELQTQEELDAAITLLEEAKKLILTLRDDTKESMDQVQRNIKYLKVTHTQTNTKIDIKS